jgi:hypothetical protein
MLIEAIAEDESVIVGRNVGRSGRGEWRGRLYLEGRGQVGGEGRASSLRRRCRGTFRALLSGGSSWTEKPTGVKTMPVTVKTMRRR